MRPSRVVPAAACLAALALPAQAAAHLRIATVAVGSTVQVAPLPPRARAAVVVRARARDRALDLTVEPGHVVVALGYLGEPFLRLSPRGVWVNGSSPTAAANGLTGRVAGGWRLVRPGASSVSWRDTRLQGVPHRGRPLAWSIPLVVDGRQVAVHGTVRALGRPAVWPWAALTALVAVVLLAATRMAGGRRAVLAGGLAAVAVLAVCVAFAADAGASPGLRIESVDEAVLALAGVGVLVGGGAQARAVAACGIGLVALAAAATKGPVFVAGHVLAVVPGTAARALVSLSLATGLAAAVGLGGAAVRDHRRELPRPDALRLPTRWG